MKLLEKYFPKIDARTLNKLQEFVQLFKTANEKINLVSRKDIRNFEERHLLHALSIAQYIRFAPGTRIADVGTGGGIPGIPLAIMFPESEFTLIDSIGKKISAVKDMTESLQLPNTKAIQVRSNESKLKFDFVLGRAVTEFPKFVKSTEHLIKDTGKNGLPGGIIYLKGGDFKNEIKPFPEADVFPLRNYYEEDFFDTKKIIYLPI